MKDHYQQSIFDGTEQSMYNQSIELIKTFEEVALQRNPVGYIPLFQFTATKSGNP